MPYDTLKNLLGAAVEPFATLGSGLVAGPAGDIHATMKLLGGASQGEALKSGEDFTREHTYLPKTEGGRQGLEGLTAPLGVAAAPFTAAEHGLAQLGEHGYPNLAGAGGGLLAAAGIVDPTHGLGKLGRAGKAAKGASRAAEGVAAAREAGWAARAAAEEGHAAGMNARAAKLARELGVAPEEAIAMATSRTNGSVGGNAITPRYLREQSVMQPGEKWLDLGAGKDAAHAQSLRDAGHDVTAYDHWVKGGGSPLLDPEALSKGPYDGTYLSNVLNVQPSEAAMASTLDQAKGALRPGGRGVANYPASPRNWTPEGDPVEAVRRMLEERFDKVNRVEGYGSAREPLFSFEGRAALPPEASVARTGPGAEMKRGDVDWLTTPYRQEVHGDFKPAMEQLPELFRKWGPAEAERAALEGVHQQPAKGGGFTGAPSSIQSVKDADAVVQHGVHDLLGRESIYPWYEPEGAYRRDAAPQRQGGNATAGIWSNQASPGQELMRDAEFSMARAFQGKEAPELTKPMFMEQGRNADAIQRGANLDDVGGLGAKTYTYANTLNDPKGGHPMVVDRHEFTARGFSDKETGGAGGGNPQHGWSQGEGYRDVKATRERLASDPELAAKWQEAYGDMDVTPSRVQENKWFPVKVDKEAAKLMGTRGGKRVNPMGEQEAHDAAVAAERANPLNRFSMVGPEIAPAERFAADAPWKGGGRTDPLYSGLDMLQHPDANPLEGRPMWGPESFAEKDNSLAAAHSRHSAEQQQAINKAGGNVKKTGKLKGEGKTFTREQHLAEGALDQEQALKDLAALRMWGEGRTEGGLSWRGRDMPVELPRGAEGSGDAARELMSRLSRYPADAAIHNLGPEAFQALGGFPSKGADVMKGRELLQRGGMPAVQSYIKKHGYKGLFGVLGATGLNELSGGDQ